MNKFYLTDKIYLMDGKLFYETKNTTKQIKPHNWHTILNDYGWEKLNIRWIKKLNRFLDKIPKNSLFGVLDCGGEGDCLFHCISHALKSRNFLNINFNYEVSDLRKMVCDCIDYEKFNEIISIYKVIKDSDEFEEDWDPYTITFEEFKEILLEGGHNYWGDDIILNILKEYLNVNIIILKSDTFENIYEYYPILYDYNEKQDSIILSYEDSNHFKLIGHFNGENMITYFNNNTIPFEILKLINYFR